MESVLDALNDMTGGRGPDACIDAVGMEAHGTTLDATVDRAKQAVKLSTDRPHALRQAILACRKGGTVSIPGVYGGLLDKFPLGAAFAKGLTFKMGQTHMQRYMSRCWSGSRRGRSTPRSSSPTGSASTTRPWGYKTFRDKEDDCIKVVLKPGEHGHLHSHGPAYGNGNGREH